MNIRKGMAVTFAERYFNVAAQFALTAIIARLMTPEEFGLAAIGVSILAIVETVRDFGISNYIVQSRDLTRSVARTGFTIIAALSCAVAAALYAGAPHMAEFYGDERLVAYVEVMALVALAGMFVSPLRAMMLRDMEFRKLAIVNLGGTVAFSGTIVSLALLGHGYMSYAWGGLAMTLTSAAFCLHLRRDYWIFRPGFRGWAGALAFGGYSSLSDTLSRVQESLPFLILGRLMPLDAVGIFNRSHFLAAVPPKLLMVGVMPVALPGFAAEARSGKDLKAPLLNAMSLMAVFLWPALILLALLAYPAVMLLLGDQWTDAAPIVQILSIASLASLPLPLAFPVLSAVGQVRPIALAGLVIVPVCAAVLGLAARYGLYAVAASFLLLMPFQAFAVLRIMKRHIPFGWLELAAALGKSAAVTLFAAAPPCVAFALGGFSFAISIPAGIGIGLLMAPGWLIGVMAVRHPVLNEIRLAAGVIAGRFGAPRLPSES